MTSRLGTEKSLTFVYSVLNIVHCTDTIIYFERAIIQYSNWGFDYYSHDLGHRCMTLWTFLSETGIANAMVATLRRKMEASAS